MKIFSYIFIICGILWCFLGGYYLWLENDPNRLQPKTVEVKNISVKAITNPDDTKQNDGTPQTITIEDLRINLPIIPAKVVNDTWETTFYGASYLTSSPIPGNKGNSVIYAHNWVSLFGRLKQAKPGQQITIAFSNGTKKVFIIKNTKIVDQNDSSIVDQTKDTRITLYTCTGFFDQQRFVVIATPESNKPSFAEIQTN